jgi:hypothetical protein
MRTHDMPKNRCPYCGYACEAATSIKGRGGPRPGSLSVCLACADISVFTEALSLRKMTEEEWNALGELRAEKL